MFSSFSEAHNFLLMSMRWLSRPRIRSFEGVRLESLSYIVVLEGFKRAHTAR